MKRILGAAVAGALALGVTACDLKLPFGGSSNNTSTAVAEELRSRDKGPIDIGKPLYTPTPIPKQAPVAAAALVDPIILPGCQVTVPTTENVPSKVNGRLLQICTEIKPGETWPPEQVFVHPVDSKRRYRKLREGDRVEAGQLVAILDDRVALAAFNSAKANDTAAKLSRTAVLEAKTAVADIKVIYDKLKRDKVAADTEYLQVIKLFAEQKKTEAEAEGNLEKSVADLEKARVTLEDHEIRTLVGGRIKIIYARAGEAVQEGKAVLLIQNDDRIRVEGLLPVQYLPRVQAAGKDTKVTIEAATQDSPQAEFPAHWQPVTGIAVSKNPHKPLIVSVSEDKTARVWDRNARIPVATFLHPAPVLAVACTAGKSEQNLCLTGAADSVGRLWDLDKLGAKEPLRALKTRHNERITAVAFAPDGRTCATADDKEVILHDVANGELRYRFQTEHGGPITAVQFTPQSKLVTVARDGTIRLWELGEKAARLESAIENRAGTVGQLGVSADGAHVLFDQRKQLQVLTLPDVRIEGVLPTPSDASEFHTFAQFSPDGKLIIAAGSGDTPLQLWKAPAAGVRAARIRNLAVGVSLPTCVAFAPDGAFAVTGTQDNKVQVWGLPERAEVDRAVDGRVIKLEPSVDSSSERKVSIWAEVEKPNGRLLPGETVTLVIPPPEPK